MLVAWDLSDSVLERDALNFVLHLAIPECSFQGDELPFLECPGELERFDQA